MRTAQLGPWEFSIPDGWDQKSFDSGVTYFQHPDETKGLYVKSIELNEPQNSSLQLAQYIQQVHESSFRETNLDAAWEVVDRRNRVDGALTHSALDLYDAKANYRVLSLVVCDRASALQLTFHDYWCENYPSAREMFAEIERSMVWVAGAA